MRIAVAGGTGIVGRHVVRAAEAAGHQVVVLARSTGVDVRGGDGLAAALAGVDAVVDTTNAGTIEEGPTTDFFVESTANLQRLGAEAGVGHLVVLSIVGIDRAPAGYYGAKLAHEQAALAGGLPVTIVRTTQFHEFPAQVISRNRQGSVVPVPDLEVQTIGARTVGRILAEVAQGPALGRAPDVGGPEAANLIALARWFTDHFGLGLDVVPADSSVPAGALLPGDGARTEGPTFDEWLTGDDAAALVRDEYAGTS